MFEFEENLSISAKIKVIGVGGGGGNAIKTMMKEQIEGVDFVAINTDLQSLQQNDAMVKIQIGHKLTRGLGAGSNPSVGREAAIEDTNTIREVLEGSDMVFITAGMGGGTGTGAAPVIANIAKEMGILTIGIVTKPFSFEGRQRMKKAEEGIEELMREVDTLICVPNDNLLNIAAKDTPILSSFKMVDHVLLQAVRGISDLITIPGLINLDFSDVRTIMTSAGIALMGTGIAGGENRAIEAAKLAISSPLLENISISGAKGILLNITGSSKMTLFEVNEASKLIQQECHEDANIIFGAVIDEEMNDDIRVTVMATGFDQYQEKKTDLKESRNTNSHYKGWIKYPEEKKRIERRKPTIDLDETELTANFAKDINIKDVIEEMNDQPEEKPVIERKSSHQEEANHNSNDNSKDENLDLPFQFSSASSASQKRTQNQNESLEFNSAAEMTSSQTSTSRQPYEASHGQMLSVQTDQPKSQVPSRKKYPSVWGETPEKQKRNQFDVTNNSPFRNENSSRQLNQMQSLKDKKRKTYSDMDLNGMGEDEYDIPAFIRRRAD